MKSKPQKNTPGRSLPAAYTALEELVRSLGGCLAPTGDFDPAALRQLDHYARLVASETAPTVTHREWLERHALRFGPPGSLSGQALADELWRLIHALAFARVFLDGTDHLSDPELYARLHSVVLAAEEPDLPRLEIEGYHWDLSGASSGDEVTWLTYYASDEDRESWALDYPGEPLPPRRPRPSNRDQRLPRGFA